MIKTLNLLEFTLLVIHIRKAILYFYCYNIMRFIDHFNLLIISGVGKSVSISKEFPLTTFTNAGIY